MSKKNGLIDWGVALAVAVIIGLFGVWGINIASDQKVSHGYPPCATEDSNNCHWDAKTQGNGKGRSYTVIDDVIYYDDDMKCETVTVEDDQAFCDG